MRVSPSFFRQTLGYIALFLGVAALELRAADFEAGRPPVRSFTRAEHRSQADFWSPIISRKSGLLYYGTHLGLIEFDGRTWRPMVGALGYNRSIVEGDHGEIYAADEDGLGFFNPPDTGTPHWTSLIEHVPTALRPLGLLHDARWWQGGAWFCHDRAVLRWQNGRLDHWPFAELRPTRLHVVGDRLLIQRRGEGLLEFVQGKFTPLPLPEEWRDDELVYLAPVGQGLLFGWSKAGLWVRDAQGNFSRWPHDATALTSATEIQNGCTLRDGSHALLLHSEEIVILSVQGQLRARLTRQNGLPLSHIYGFTEDAQRHLWLGTNDGPVRVAWQAGVTQFDAQNGLSTARTASLTRHDGTLHVLNADGLYRLVPSTAPGTSAHFIRDPVLDGLDRPSLLCSHAAGLLVVSQQGLHLLTAGGLEALLPSPTPAGTVIVSKQDPSRLFLGLNSRIITGRLVGKIWQQDGVIPGIDTQLADLVQESDGTLWASTVSKGVYRITPPTTPGDWNHAAVRHYTEADGLPANHGAIYVWESSLGAHIDTAQGMYRFNRQTGRMEFDAALVAFEKRQIVLNPLAGGATGEIWTNGILMNSEISYPLARLLARPDGSFTFQRAPHDLQSLSHAGGAYRLFAEPDAGIVWARSDQGLLRIETSSYGESLPPSPPLLRRFAAEGRELTVPFRAAPTGTPLALTFSTAPIEIQFSAGTLFDPALDRFQYRMLGFNSEWSAVTEKTEAIYTNLEGGPFRFQVRTVTKDGLTGEPTEARFSVAPPWQRSRAALAIYLLLGVAAIAWYIRWRLGRAERERLRLEALVTVRTSELAIARDVAETASRAKSAFLASMSHELRTPLNGVLGYAQLLQNDRRLAPDQQERLRIVHQSGEHLLHMINDVLDLAKIEAGKLTLRPAPFALADLLRDITATHAHAAAGKRLIFTLETSPDLPAWVESDAQKLRQILDNLIGNAIKFTAQGSVQLRVEAVAPSAPSQLPTINSQLPLTFSVTDTGPGISTTDQQRLFQAFEQATINHATTAGHGLGLAISRALVERFGGTLTLDSAPGRGSTFAFTLDLPVATAGLVATSAGRRIVGHSGPALRALIIDDHEINRRLLGELLAPLGFDCADCASPVAALARLTEGSEPWPDVAIIDLRMPGLDGLELTRRLRALPRGPELKILLTSASVIAFDPAEATRAGCDDFLPKPFRTADLLDKLGRLLHLTWRESESVPPFPATGAPLPAATRAALRELLATGDLEIFSAELTRQRAAHPDAAARFDELAAAAASFQLARLRQLLE